MIDKELLAQSSRDALSLYFEYKGKTEDYSLFLEEKSDYEVLHLISTGKFPSEEFNITEQEAIDKIASEDNIVLAESFLVNPLKFYMDVIAKYNPGNIIDRKFSELINNLPKYSLSRYARDIENIEIAIKNPLASAAQKAHMSKTKELLLKQIEMHGDKNNHRKYLELINKQKDNLKNGSLGDTLSKFAGNTIFTLTVLAAVALVLYFGYQVYQRFFTEAGKACNNYSDEMKTKCMKKYKADSIKRQITEIEKGMQLCERTNDPSRCQEMLHQRIRKLKAKIRQLA